MHGIILTGTNSGCGKTTVTIGLMALLKSIGKQVAPFKTGPDYIDPLFHREVLNTPSYNLDTFMLSKATVRHLFLKHCVNKDMAIVEGVMGMYDGMGATSKGSSYELSKTLQLPNILVVSCKSLYQSVAAIVKGYATLQPDANVKGVILNHVPSKSYYLFLKSIIERDCNIPCIGYLPTNSNFALESRHLGLIQAEEVGELSAKIEQLKDTLSETIDIVKLLEISKLKAEKHESFELPNLDLSDLHIGIAYDKAFRFYYQDNLELLKELGAKIHYFSPLHGNSIPIECNCLYIGGGYPEVFAQALSENKNLRLNLKKLADSGMPIYAECGGLMYLSNNIIDIDNTSVKMTGIFNASIQMTERLQHFGYAIAQYNGTETKCHEFHRSKVLNNNKHYNYTLEYKLHKPEKPQNWQCGLKTNNCLAAYAHIHFYSNFQFFEQIVKLWKTATT